MDDKNIDNAIKVLKELHSTYRNPTTLAIEDNPVLHFWDLMSVLNTLKEKNHFDTAREIISKWPKWKQDLSKPEIKDPLYEVYKKYKSIKYGHHLTPAGKEMWNALKQKYSMRGDK